MGRWEPFVGLEYQPVADSDSPAASAAVTAALHEVLSSFLYFWMVAAYTKGNQIEHQMSAHQVNTGEPHRLCSALRCA